MGKSKILVFGGSGYIGKYMVEASILLGHPTFVYSRASSNNTTEFLSMGVTVVQGHLGEQEKMVQLLRQVDVVISTLPYPQVLDQLKIIDAIKIAGNIKRFLPSDFGCEEDEAEPLPPFQTFLDKKRKIRRVVEQSGIPYTFVSANCFGAYFINYLLHPHDDSHQQDNTITVYGTGEAKAVLNYEGDIGVWTIKVANDPRTCNKRVTYRPSQNIVTQLQIISLWEKKTGKTFNKVHVSEEDIVKLSQSLPEPQNIPVAILHSVFVKGELVSFELESEKDPNMNMKSMIIEGSRLYPEWEFSTFDHLLDLFLLDGAPKPASAAFE